MPPPANGSNKRSAVKIEPGAATSRAAKKQKPEMPEAADPAMKQRFLSLFSRDEYKDDISNTQIEAIFNSEEERQKVVLVINELLAESRLVPLQGAANGSLHYQLVSEEDAKQFYGLDPNARLVYQSIQRAGALGAWTKDIRRETNIQPPTLNKIFKALEGRRLIKQVKSVNAKAKKLYMLYDLQPSTELTGGVWYSDLEFDHEFISELRGFLLQCLRRMNNGEGCTVEDLISRVELSKVSRVSLNQENVQQLLGTLLFDHLVEQTERSDGTTIYTACRRVSTACDFKWWSDALAPDFHFRTIQFEDGVVLEAQEPHYHTA